MGGFMKMMSPAAMVADQGPKVLSPVAMALDKKGDDEKKRDLKRTVKKGSAGTSLLGNA